MIVYRCQSCKRPLEVDDDLAGKRAACPHCGAVSDVPAMAFAQGVPLARAVDEAAAGQRAARQDRAVAMGLPPDSGPEQHVMTIHPVMLRARPFKALLLFVLIVGGLVGVGWGLLVPPLLWVAVAGAIAAGLGLLWWVSWWVGTRSVALIITNKRTTERRGLLRRETKEILHDRVQDLQVSQSFPQRMLGIGTVGVSNAGEAGVEIEVADLPRPMHVRDVIDAYREVG